MTMKHPVIDALTLSRVALENIQHDDEFDPKHIHAALEALNHPDVLEALSYRTIARDRRPVRVRELESRND